MDWTIAVTPGKCNRRDQVDDRDRRDGKVKSAKQICRFAIVVVRRPQPMYRYARTGAGAGS